MNLKPEDKAMNKDTDCATVITDPTSPMFDLETLMTKIADGSVQV